MQASGWNEAKTGSLVRDVDGTRQVIAAKMMADGKLGYKVGSMNERGRVFRWAPTIEEAIGLAERWLTVEAR